MNDQNYDLIDDNPSPRCACALVVDTSGSMGGQPIAELNEGVRQFISEVLADEYACHSVELGVFAFGGRVTSYPFTPLGKLADGSKHEDLEAYGSTPMGEAVNTAMRALEERKAEYKKAGVSYYQPWLVLMTDGAPTDRWQDAAQRLREEANNRKIVVFGIGIGEECNMEVLAEFCPEGRPPKKLAGLKFKEFFAWLSQSMSQVSQSSPGDSKVDLPPTDTWGQVDV